MSGLQFSFTNGEQSPFIQTSGVSGITKKMVQIDVRKPIKYIQVKVYDGVRIDGIRFYDEDYEPLAN